MGTRTNKHHHSIPSKMVKQLTQDFPYITIKNYTNSKLKGCQKTVFKDGNRRL